jgi:hypothetical protein
VRGALAMAAAASLVACYQPSVRDCTVSCNSEDDCAGDQVCAGGMCAAAGTSCELAVDAARPDASDVDGVTIDASAIDAMTIDSPPPDAGVILRVVVSGRGSVVGDQPGIDCAGPQGDCSYSIAPGTVMLTAVDGPGGHAFVDWTTPNCIGAGRTCGLSVTVPVTLVGASFN